MAEPLIFAITGDKGGVGKSTIAILLTEWLLMRGYSCEFIDADPSQNAQTCLDKCKDEGYNISEPNAPIKVVDCAGTTGSSITKYVIKADVILVPFKPHVADIETVVGWFVSAKETLQDRVIFIPTHIDGKSGTREQKEGKQAMTDILKEQGRGSIGPEVKHRPAVYGPVMNERADNFFHLKLDDKAKEELNELFFAVTDGLLEKKAYANSST